MSTYIYARTSDIEVPGLQTNGSEGAILELQHEYGLIQEYCRQRGWPESSYILEQGVPWNTEVNAREQAAALLQRLESGDVIVVYALERLFSSCYDAYLTLEALCQAGVALHVVVLGGDVTDPGLQFDLVTAASLFAALERRRSAERILRLKHKQRSKGRYLGGNRPFGYMIHSNGRLIENPMEQKLLKRIMQLRKQGKSLRAIADEVSTPVAPISFKTVQRVMQRHLQQNV